MNEEIALNSVSILLAEQVLGMQMVTEAGKRARELARQVLASNDFALHQFRLIAHATAPSHDDGTFHEAAYEIATAAIEDLEKYRPFETNEEPQ